MSLLIRMVFGLVLLFSLNSFAGDSEEFPEVVKLQKDMPHEVASWISRTVECMHWGGEASYDQARREWIEKAVKKARCGELVQEEKRFREQFVNDKKVMDVLEETHKLDLW